MFAYCGNNPVMFADPSGMYKVSEVHIEAMRTTVSICLGKIMSARKLSEREAKLFARYTLDLAAIMAVLSFVDQASKEGAQSSHWGDYGYIWKTGVGAVFTIPGQLMFVDSRIAGDLMVKFSLFISSADSYRGSWIAVLAVGGVGAVATVAAIITSLVATGGTAAKAWAKALGIGLEIGVAGGSAIVDVVLAAVGIVGLQDSMEEYFAAIRDGAPNMIIWMSTTATLGKSPADFWRGKI